MGIRGLTKALKRRAGELQPEILPVDATLVVDGDGWAFEMINRVRDFMHGGNYLSLHEEVCREVQNLLGMGLQLVFYFGGGSDDFKSGTKLKRTRDREEEWMNAYAMCRERKLDPLLSLPIAPMGIIQVVATLEEIGMCIVRCNEEADQPIARKVRDHNQQDGKETYFCYGRDSDFLVMKDCPYIEFGTLIYDTLTVRAVVYRRSNTAALLRLPSERLLVEMCIMFGNDFTSEYAQYTPSPYAESPAFQQASAVSSYVDWFSTVDPSYKAESITNVELSIAIKYSRAFYELENLDIYRSELKAYRIANSYCEPQLEMSFSLSIEEKDRILGWYLENRMPTGKTSGMIALRYLERKIVDLNGSEVHISHEHFEAFSKMLDVTMNSDYTAHPFRISMKWLPIPSWDDLLASHVFQLVMLQLVHIVEKFDGTCKFLPKINFDGAVFHGFLNILKSELAAESVFDITTSLANKFAGISVSDVGSMAIPNQVLPIDAYQEEILYRIGRDRVTIIHGETGCGKSSRVPAMLLEESKRNGNHCKMMISQPRRIAASSLMKRLRETIGVEVGMRMGHGVKDESSDTKLFFVTTGYLVRLLAYHPSHFNNHTHLIIDEVHERSVDGDVLCYLARRLLNSNSNIKLVLMSATMHIKLYQDYFAPTDSINYGDLQCLSVGVRRFPLQIFYSDNMCSGGSKAGLPKAFAPLCDKISKQIEKLRTIDEGPSLEFVKNQYAMVNHLVREVVELGTGVLVFVSGIADITEISDYFADDNKYVVVAIHSDIPFEEQELAFQPVASNQIKVVIATNAAESSITLPDVDVVICLGTHKAVRYDTATRRVQLVNQFISKASSNQRAGRTGRTRPGKVYRLYTSQLFDKMNDHDLPEVMRKPLEDVILNLRAMLEESRDFTGVVPILESLLEAPKTENIEASFEELYLQNMITIADDNGELTPVGRMAGNLPVDMHLSRLIALGISLGIGAEAVAIAAALSIPKTPFRIAHFLIHKDPDEYNDIMQRSFLAAVKADGGVYSEPISLVNLLCEWRKVSKDSSNQRQINNWLRENNVVRARIQQFDGIAKNLARTVTSVLSRIDNRIESNRIPRYDLSGWLAMQEDTVSIGSAPSSVSPSLPFLDDDDIADIALDIEFMRDEINEGNSEMLAKLDAVADLRIDMSSATEQAKEITACRLNLCRLILVWSSDGFLLNQSRKMKVAANYYDTIRLGDKYLKNDQLKSLFPVDVPWEISYSGTRIYDGKVHGEQCLDVFHRMCEVGILMSDCRYDATAPTHGTWSCSLVSDAQPPIIWISVVLNNKKTTIFFALPDSTSRQVLEAIFSGGKFEKTLDKHGIYDVYSVVGASKKELTNLGLSRSVLSRTMTITIPATGNSKLTVCGCEPNFGDLSCIFDIDEAAIHAKQSREIENSDRSLPPGISVQIFDKNCVLKFPSERNVLANPYHFSNSIISDYPIGMRLFNSYKSSRYKEKCVLVRKHPNIGRSNGKDNYATDTPTKIVTGSVEWLNMKQSETAGQNQNVGMTTSEKDIDVISAATPEPTWKGKSMFGEKILSKKIYLPVASPIGTAIHTGTEPLFGTAFRVMDIYPGNMQKCDGISLFPTGYKWITMAYECIGLDKRIIFDEANAKLMKNEKITPQERKLLDLVSGLLAEQIEHLPVGYNSDLAACVKALFAPWGRQHGDDAICQTPAPLMASSRKKRLEEAKIPNIDKDAGVIGYDKTVDYKSFLYKEVNKNFGDAAAKGISYLTSAKNGNFETIVSVPFNGVTLSEASVGKNKAQSRNIAACLCLGSMLKNVSNVEKSSCDSNMISPVKLQKIKFRDLLKQCISDLFGKNAASSIEYEFSAKKLKVNADLQFTLDEYNTMYSFRVVGMKSKNEAKEKLAEDAINFIATIKK